MKRLFTALLALTSLITLAAPAGVNGADGWIEGTNYFIISPALHTSAPPGKVEVTEVFSYGCPYCNAFRPIANQLKAALPPNAVMTYVPASFSPAEDWPMFQRAYVTAQILGVADKGHDGMFDAVWKGGELAIVDAQTNRIKSPLPIIEDAAHVYNRLTGVPFAKFVATSQSFSVDMKMKEDDDFVIHGQVDSTPTIVVNGKYRLNLSSAGSADKLIALVKFLVAKETH
jgi:protein dithiol oxidoreductase (disulfide-forming)